MPTYNERVFDLVRQYRYNSHLFSEEQTDELQELANQFDIPFNRKTDEFNLRKNLSQLQMGFLEGFTTIPVGKLSGKEPRTTYESISHSLGHLAGFAPGILAAPLKLGAKGLMNMGAKSASKYVGESAQIAAKANHWSIPMMGGDFAKKGTDKLLFKTGAETVDFMKRGAAPRAMLDQAVHLGTASAVSSIWKGPDEMINAGVHGAVAGGAFGGLGEMKIIGNYLKSKDPINYRKGEQQLKGVIGASMLGIPTYLEDAPAEMIIYQTLLGGFFGYNARPAVEAEGGKFIQRLMYTGSKNHAFNPEMHPEFSSYSKGAQDYIVKESTHYAKEYLNRNLVDGLKWDKDMVHQMIEENVRATEGIPPDKLPKQELIDREFRAQANDFYLTYAEGKSYNFYLHKDVVDRLNNQHQKEEPNDPHPNKSDVERNANLEASKDRESVNNVFAIGYDPIKKTFDIIDGIGGNKIGTQGTKHGQQLGDRRVDRPADILENTEYITFDSVLEIKNGKFTGKYKPLDYGGLKGERNWTKRAQWALDIRLDQHNRYIYGGVKDKGILTIREYHPDKDIYTKEEIFRELSRDGSTTVKEIKDSYEISLKKFKEYYQDKKKPLNETDLNQMHERAWKSNVLVEAQRNGMYEGNLSQIHNLMKKGYAKNVIEWNKREQLYHDKSVPLPKDTLGLLKTAIFKDVKDIELIPGSKDKYYDSDTDGTIYFLPKDMQNMLKTLGLPDNVSMNKPVIVVKTKDYGTLIVKSAGRAAPKEIVEYMEANGLRSIVMSSAAKHTGGLSSNTFDINALKKGKYNHVGELNTVEIKDTDIRINLGTHENPKSALKRQKLALQLAGAFNTKDSPGALDAMWNEVYLPNIKGNKELNTKVEEYLNDKVKLNTKDVKVDDLGLELIHRIFTEKGDSKLASSLARQISRMDTNGELQSVDTFSREEYSQYIFRNNRVLDLSNFSQSQRETGIHGRKFFEDVYRKYMLNRLISPRYKYSSKAWLAPKDPHILLSNNIKDGHFKLDKGMGNMKIRYNFLGKTGEKDTTLYEAWKHHLKINKGDPYGKNGDYKAFEMLVIRVPSDSMSGTRVLKFDGFTDQRGYSITTNAKDNAYLGGADKDSDSAFIYQNMPRKVTKAFKEKQNQWEINGKWKDGKDTANDKLFKAETEDSFNYIGSKFSPSMRRIVADTAARGNQGIGQGIVAKNTLLTFADTLVGKGVVKFDLIKKTGEKYGEAHIELKKDGHDQIVTLAREMVNRSADAANYSSMINPKQYGSILFKAGFNTKVWITKNGKTFRGTVNYDILKNSISQLKDISTAIKFTKPNMKSQGDKPITWDYVQEGINRVPDYGKYSNLNTYVANYMKTSKLTGKMLTDKFFESYVKELTSVKKQIVKDLNKNSQIKKLNQLLNFTLNPEKIGESRYKLEGDFAQLSAWSALTKKGQEVYDALDRMGIPDKTKNQFIEKILKPIALEATAVKQKTRNFETLGDSDKNLTKYSHTFFDDAVLRFNVNLLGLTGKYQKIFGDKNLLTKELLKDYFDLWLLSPFYYGKTVTHSMNLPFQSQYVGNRAIKTLTNEHQSIYEYFQKKIEDPKTDIESPIYDANKPTDYRILNKITPENQMDFIRSRAITDADARAVVQFQKNLADNKFVRENFTDFYENFTAEVLGKRKDIELLDMNDINAINKYLESIDVRRKANGTKLPNEAWRASIEHMDEVMRDFDANFFESTLEKVHTRDGVVKRTVKKYTGTIGMLKSYIHKTNSTMEALIQKLPEYNKKRYLHLRLDEKSALDINKIVVQIREARNQKIDLDHTTLPEYKRLAKEKFKIKDKEYTLDEMIDITDKTYTKDFEQFGDQFIFAKDGKGAYIANNKGQWTKIDIDKKYGSYNKFLKWDNKGRFNIENFIKRVITDVQKGKELPKPKDGLTLEAIYRANYELELELLLKNKNFRNKVDSQLKKKLTDQQFREWYRDKKKFVGVGRFKPEEYFPHLNYGRDKQSRIQIEKYVQEKIDKAKTAREKAIIRAQHDLHVLSSQKEDGGGATDAINSVMNDVKSSFHNTMINNRASSVNTRTKDNMPGWDPSHNAIQIYKESIMRSLYKNLSAFQAKHTIEAFEAKKPFGNNTKDWALYLRAYFRDSMGLPTTFDSTQLEAFKAADPKFKKRAYYLTSDQVVIKALEKINTNFKKHGRSLPFVDKLPTPPNPKLEQTDKKLYELQKQAYIESMTRFVHNMGRYEAKFQLWTLLGHTKIMTGNLFGGTQMTITRGGLKNFFRANNKKWLEKNIIKDINGNYQLKFMDGKEVKTKKDLDAWLSEQGVIESFISNELSVNAELKDVKGVPLKNLNNFIKEISKKLIRDPNTSDKTMVDIAKKHKVDKLMDTSAAWFMQTSERKLRRDAYLTHAIEYMEHFGKDSLRLSLNDPAVKEAGLRGVEATQFIYHSSARPAYMRTALGKTLSRFKLFVFNSVRVRKEMLRKASYYGYQPGTKEFERFKTDFAINMFVMALGTAFAYSLFDTTLPPPYDWAQETGEWLLGDKKERDKAFFAQWPYPIAPLNIVTPPAARIPMSFFSSLINKDWERFFDYHAYTMFPFGRMIRSIDKTIDEPYGTVEGRAMQQFFGIPLDTFRSKVKRSNVLEERRQKINKELEEMEEWL